MWSSASRARLNDSKVKCVAQSAVNDFDEPDQTYANLNRRSSKQVSSEQLFVVKIVKCGSKGRGRFR
jgi:hypothetical protein